ncbi:amidohydrolase family protein [Lutimonas sp.]|uniref:metal-dependent hydrolase family protein n=1 Tax=Lutimonas sp. TaxID=1872403 RepID=UPI003D9B7C6F
MKYLSILFFLSFTSFMIGQNTLIHCGKLIDTKNGKVLEKMTITIENNKITQVENGFAMANSDQDQIIDLKDKTVLPGLIDMHVHLEGESNPTSYLQKFTLNTSDRALRGSFYGKKTLLAGFTTVRDLGGSGANISLRNAINNGFVEGPRIYTAGKALGTTGGHADPSNGVRKEIMGDPGPAEGVVNGTADAKKAVRQRYKNGADLIKITATGGVLSMAKSGQNPQFTFEEIRAICETAKDYDMHVAAHAHGDEGMQRAILGGVKTIEHGTLMSDKTMEMMKEHDVYYVPTLTAGKEVSDKAKIKGYYPDIIVPKALEIGPKIQGTFERAYKKGVKIAFGTDAGVFPHGINGKEFHYMVEVGMTEMDAIQAATIVNAVVLKNEQIGFITPGNYADIIAVEEDPTKNIKTLENVVFVMKDGIIYKN